MIDELEMLITIPLQIHIWFPFSTLEIKVNFLRFEVLF